MTAIMRLPASASRQRTGLASTASTSARVIPDPAVTSPMATTWLATVHPSAASRLLATAPHATFAAVSRALARSITSRMSSRPYSRAPPRSAWPGRGTTTRSAADSPPAGASTASTSPQFAASRLGTNSASGAPVVRP